MHNKIPTEQIHMQVKILHVLYMKIYLTSSCLSLQFVGFNLQLCRIEIIKSFVLDYRIYILITTHCVGMHDCLWSDLEGLTNAA